MQEGAARQTNAIIARINRTIRYNNGPVHNSSSIDSSKYRPARPIPTPLDPVARETSLRQLITTAIDLASGPLSCLFAHQTAANADKQTVFDPARMEDVGGLLDEDSLAAGPAVRCAMFPGVVKRGDENGGNLQQYENVISKARVLCCHPED
ncbi:hypothetical protein MCOR02_003164 [Pyricularia oryzae]|nr:hypothetical protein MCOR02_003164 [Pyricularia oryzae]